MNSRILAAVTIAALLAAAFGASSNKPHFSTRFDHAASDLTTVQTPIQQELHARALGILRERTMAKDEATNDAALREKACASFNKSPLNVTCE